MKQIVPLAIFACLASSMLAAPGDTLRIESHQQTHWNWAGSWFDTVDFPATGNYRKILMNYTLGCPSIGCSEWDYTTHIDIGDPVNDSTMKWFELVRIITPYAGNKGATWNHTWVIDVTDYAPLFTDERVIAARYSGYQDGFTVTITFDFIEGTPTRDVLAIDQLYHGTYRYGFANDPIENHLVPKDVDIHPNTASSKFRLAASGHSFGGNENCAEFCQKYYRLYINNQQTVERDVWRDDCGSNPLEAQTGTWIYERAGWCPGAETMRYDDEVMHRLTPGQTATLNVDWEPYNYTGGAGFDPQYYIESVLFQYGSWAHELDASIDDVLKPSLNDQVWDVNPVCNNPEIVVSNQGSEALTRIEFEYWTEGSPEKLTYKWQGILVSGTSMTITLPSVDWKLFGGKTDNVFHVKIIGVNNTEDENEENNLFHSKFQETVVFPSSFVIAFNNNSANNETTYKVINDSGTVVFSRGISSPGMVVKDTVTIPKGCYRLLIEDSECDGLSFFANSDGNGRIWLHNADEATFFPPLHQFEPQFGCSTELNFTVGYELGIETIDQSLAIALKAYPNPTDDVVCLAIEEGFSGGLLEVFNQQGQRILSDALSSKNGLEIRGLDNGVYHARYSSAQGSAHTQFVVVR